MSGSVRGRDLCEGFFNEEAKPVLDKYFPDLGYSAGLIGYGSDVLGYDDEVSRDHMWGPRFYLFLDNISRADEIMAVFSDKLPYTYKGFSVNFTPPDINDNGVRHPEFISEGRVDPLIFITTFDGFLEEQLGSCDLKGIKPLEWLAFSEHRLLSLVSGTFFHDGLRCADRLRDIEYYPHDVRLYLIASCWSVIASEQAFVRRCGDCGDDTGARIICARIAERLIRLCFLYKGRYTPYSKWLGTAYAGLDIDEKLKRAINSALSAGDHEERERYLIEAQCLTAELHNSSGLTERVEYRVESYFGREIKVIFAEKFADAAVKCLKDTEYESVPLIGSFSQLGGLSDFSDDKRFYRRIAKLYQGGDTDGFQ